MHEVPILAVPGLRQQSPAFLGKLAELARRNRWDVTGIAGVISHESRFMPAARSPRSTATGLIQFIESTARALGTTTAALAEMSAVEQLPFVEAFFKRFMPRLPSRPEDYLLVTYGRSDAVDKPDAFILDHKDSDDPRERARYAANSGFDELQAGTITVGDLRASMSDVLNAARGQYLRVSLPSSSGGSGGALLLGALLFGPEIFRGLREVFR